jgi:hypothetical protein
MLTFLVLGTGLSFALLAYATTRFATPDAGTAPMASRPDSRFGGAGHVDESEAATPAWASFPRAM